LARCLIIGCGCRGLSLGERLRTDGHTVRGTTRDRGHVEAIEAAGIEPHVGDPDRVATLAPALDHVTVACILLGSATGSPERLAALHRTRLDMLLSRMLDTTVRGIIYEASGTVEDAVLREGARHVLAACEASMIPCALLEADPADHRGWLSDAHRAVTNLLAG
jgi:homoaconitase/3-isopropylmalate dehydratase large subunit